MQKLFHAAKKILLTAIYSKPDFNYQNFKNQLLKMKNRMGRKPKELNINSQASTHFLVITQILIFKKPIHLF